MEKLRLESAQPSFEWSLGAEIGNREPRIWSSSWDESHVTNKQLLLPSKTHQTSRIMNSIVAKEIFISELLVTIFNNTKFRLYHTDKDIAKFCLFVRLMGR